MGRVAWSPRALRELEGVENHIAQDSPIAATRMYDRLWSAGNALADFPLRGRLRTRVVRELLTVKPYLIRYVVRSDGNVLITGVRHAARE